MLHFVQHDNSKHIQVVMLIFGSFLPGAKKQPPIIGATCAFDAKIYKNVDGVFDVSACVEGNKKNFKLFYFCFQLSSLLVETMPSRSRRFCGNFRPNSQ